jgi:ATP-dependent RNA helicase DOB1
LLATELMYSNVYSDLTTQQTVALVSCLIYNERNEEEVKLPPELERGYKQLEECARRVGQVQYDAGAEIDVEMYVHSFQPHLMNVVYAWCHGAKFSEICKMSDIFEGSIIRALRRLEELLRQYASAAKSVGNKDLEVKFTTGIELLKRDIVFAASLYL